MIPAVTPAASPRLPRGFLAAPSQIHQCFQRHPKTEPKTHRVLDAVLPHFRLQLASFLAQFWDDFPLQFFDLFSMRVFLILALFLITPTFHFGALAYTPCDFSSFRQVAKSTNTTPNYLQKYFQNPAKIKQKNIKICLSNGSWALDSARTLR